ncbi:MAG: recombination mediator RecR [Alphaproteobacteria bacterium]|jgi:recombination protein RecR|nr:recombination mediator RecR [Alphaproteobacteria bacterium]MDP6830928.1 recombination mediator RecR [Alphaproteobacteria bacterium]MDP6875461.1 recombination mediator RecR [Alphaproteobacteria bacterium]
MTGTQIDQLILLLAKLPGLGPRSARRAALHLIDRKESLLRPLAQAMSQAADSVAPCDVCGNLDSVQPCAICRDERRDGSMICVVESVADLWALERSGVFRGRYHVLGGTLSALDGIGPEDLNVGALLARAGEGAVAEVILATNATVDGQTTAHYLAEKLADCGVKVSGLAHGVPVGGELDYLDDGTLATALGSRRPV